MASPLQTRKQAVDLGSTAPRVSKIRRDPPPKVKQIEIRDPKELERQDVVIGVLAFAFAIFVIVIAVASYNGWSPKEYTVRVDMGDA
jgi:hypothetical protein